MARYVSGLCVAGLALCGGGWLILAALAFNGEAGDAGRVNLVTGAVLVLAGGATALSWAAAWRRRLRAVGVLAVPFLPVSRREARRNRRQLARDVRTAARLSKRADRENRRAERRDRGERVPPAGLEVAGPAAPGPAGPEPVAPVAAGHGGNDDGRAGYGRAGYDGASAADVLGELRTLLGPLLTAAGANQLAGRTEQWPAEVPPAAPWRPQHWRAPQEWTPPPRAVRLQRAEHRPEQSPQPGQDPPPQPRPGGREVDDELQRIADGEEAWW